jgi:hypothetical protein
LGVAFPWRQLREVRNGIGQFAIGNASLHSPRCRSWLHIPHAPDTDGVFRRNICLPSARSIHCRLLLLVPLVSHDYAALHDKLHAFHLRDVGQGIAGNGNDVGKLAFFDTPDLV